MAKFTFDGAEYDTDTLSPDAQKTLEALRFVERQLVQKKNELAIADTARIAYRRALKKELGESPASDDVTD